LLELNLYIREGFYKGWKYFAQGLHTGVGIQNRKVAGSEQGLDGFACNLSRTFGIHAG
jgi:hypothetical protein